MLHLLLYGLLAIVLAGGLFGLAVRFLPAGEQIAPAVRDEAPWRLPADRVLRAEEVDSIRLPVALRGYRFAETDLLLDRLAGELRARDVEITRLRSEFDAAEPVAAAAPLPAAEPTQDELPLAAPEPVTGPHYATQSALFAPDIDTADDDALAEMLAVADALDIAPAWTEMTDETGEPEQVAELPLPEQVQHEQAAEAAEGAEAAEPAPTEEFAPPAYDEATSQLDAVPAEALEPVDEPSAQEPPPVAEAGPQEPWTGEAPADEDNVLDLGPGTPIHGAPELALPAYEEATAQLDPAATQALEPVQEPPPNEDLAPAEEIAPAEDAAPEAPAPDEAALEETVPEETVPEETVPDNAASEAAAPEEGNDLDLGPATPATDLPDLHHLMPQAAPVEETSRVVEPTSVPPIDGQPQQFDPPVFVAPAASDEPPPPPPPPTPAYAPPPPPPPPTPAYAPPHPVNYVPPPQGHWAATAPPWTVAPMAWHPPAAPQAPTGAPTAPPVGEQPRRGRRRRRK